MITELKFLVELPLNRQTSSCVLLKGGSNFMGPFKAMILTSELLL